MKHIRILSPSGAIDPKYIDGAMYKLRHWGYRVSEGRYTRGKCGRFAGTAEERLTDLLDAWADTSTDVILCARGGYGLQQIVEQFDHQVQPIGQKLLVGFSDITVLHQWCALRGMESLHGLMCKHLTELDETGDVIRAWRAAIEGEQLSYKLPSHPLNREGRSSGRLIGGNLSVLYGLQGTPYSLSRIMDTMDQKPILFLEDIAEHHYHIDRMMQNLRLSGVMARLGGLVVGQWTDMDDDEKMGCSIEQTIRHAADGYDYPIVFGMKAGHVDDNYPLLMNAKVEIEVGEICKVEFAK